MNTFLIFLMLQNAICVGLISQGSHFGSRLEKNFSSVSLWSRV